MKFYAVAVGAKVGIYETWSECSKNVTGYSGAKFKSFSRREEAEKFISDANETSHEVAQICNKRKIDVLDVNEQNEPKKTKLDEAVQSPLKPLNGWDDDIEGMTINLKAIPKPKTKAVSIQIFTDGACSKNGSAEAVAGYGIYFEDKDLQVNNVSSRVSGKQTNNRAELTAILEALKMVTEESDVCINTDSLYCIKGITGINKVIKNKDLFAEIDKVLNERIGRTHFNKVKGHSGQKDGNYYADLLAEQSLNKDLIS
jgi:ribonuclease HI